MSFCKSPSANSHSWLQNGGHVLHRKSPAPRIHSSFTIFHLICNSRRKDTRWLSGSMVCIGWNRRVLDKQLVFSMAGRKTDLRTIGQTSHSTEVSRSINSSDLSVSKTSLVVAEDEQPTRVEFQLKFRADYGQQIKIVGSDRHFGSWAIARSPSMDWHEGDVWTKTISLPAGQIYEYKYVIVESNGATVVRWQQGNNCVLAIGMEDTELKVGDNWEGNPGAKVASKGQGVSTKEDRLLRWAKEMKSLSKGNTSIARKQQHLLEKTQEENRLARQEASRLKSELRMASMTRQAAERQVKELQQENRRLLSIVMEQQTVHKTVLEQTLQILSETENEDNPVNSEKDGKKKNSKVFENTDNAKTVPERGTNGTQPPPISSKSSKPRRRYSRRRKRQNVSTRTAALSAS